MNNYSSECSERMYKAPEIFMMVHTKMSPIAMTTGLNVTKGNIKYTLVA